MLKDLQKILAYPVIKTLFDSGLYFTYNEKHLATYYNYYNNLMNFWKNVLGNYFYTINYEDLINRTK